MIYVMSDIHGNMKNYRSIMKQINLQPEDNLYILGDVIDRYPDGGRILREIIKMPNVHMLLGNHEHMMLEAMPHPSDRSAKPNARKMKLWYRNGGMVTHTYMNHIPRSVRAEIFDYLKALPLNIDIEVNGKKYKLVHASPIENLSRAHRDYDSLEQFAVWERWNETHPVPEGYTLIFGHTPTIHFKESDPLEIWCNDEAIGIDCGSGYSNDPNYYGFQGRLACLRLDDMKEFYSETINRKKEG